MGFRGGGPIEVSLGQSFALKPGQQAAISSEKFVIRFASVSEDSRCPKGEQCIVAGNARVELEVTVGGAEPELLELNTSRAPSIADMGGFRVALVTLEPYPVSGRQIRPEEYLASVSVHRL